MVARVLFVCAQNVCRSPLMSAAFEHALAATPGDGGIEWSVGSAGVAADAGHRTCRVATEIAPGASGHRSLLLTPAMLDDSDLVIAASLAERAAIARLRPAARTRTFTLREALLLESVQPIAADGLPAYAAALDARRGTVEPPRTPAFRWRRDRDNPLDVVDVHKLGSRTHRRGLVSAAEDAALLARRVMRALDPAAAL